MPDNILFSSEPASDLSNFLTEKQYSSVTVLGDTNTLRYCYPKLSTGLPKHNVISVKSGEEHKNLRTCEYIWQKLTDAQVDRHGVMIVIGGGVLGDMGGFCAATYKRGIDFILIPTTLLSQVDASIGGKLGVDFNNYKNHIGVFQVPALTILSTVFLETLPDNEKKSGFAEVVKHVLISDRELWERLKTTPFDKLDWNLLLRHSVEFKLKVVIEDPRERGLRKILNTGHTIGHALETFLLNSGRKVMHGEAVAAGMIAENQIAVKRGMLSRERHHEITQYIIGIFGKLLIHENEDESVTALTLQDKKNKGNRILSVLLEDIGKATWDCEITVDEVKGALAFYRSIQM
jgi:3-dehydroquinate synthase